MEENNTPGHSTELTRTRVLQCKICGAIGDLTFEIFPTCISILNYRIKKFKLYNKWPEQHDR